MPLHSYTSEQIDFLRRAYPYLTVKSLTRAFNCVFDESKTVTRIRCTLHRYGIRSGHVPKLMENRLRLFTPEQDQFLRNHYAGRSARELTALFNDRFDAAMTVRQIKIFVKNRGIRSGRTGRFEKGHTPHNKGVKGWQAGGRSEKTRFKPGQRGINWVPLGSERVTREGILQRKVSDTGYPPRDWKSLHVLLWERHHGPVPDGHIVVFRDGNPEKIVIENLACITRADNLLRNSIHNLPEALKDVIRIRGVLNRHINQRIGKHEK
jgi:hypothetical protein